MKELLKDFKLFIWPSKRCVLTNKNRTRQISNKRWKMVEMENFAYAESTPCRYHRFEEGFYITFLYLFIAQFCPYSLPGCPFLHQINFLVISIALKTCTSNVTLNNFNYNDIDKLKFANFSDISYGLGMIVHIYELMCRAICHH